jgi:hypothetical protein
MEFFTLAGGGPPARAVAKPPARKAMVARKPAREAFDESAFSRF